ncbi:hypothetical protein [Actinoplanes sp. NPDC049118]|uniref:hypothetical protein n=1 Tax=Actinoplanes sp. NPDC049118 TaxID=3155769 RepID=UPI0033C6ADAB
MRRPLTDAELHDVRQHLHGDADCPRALVDAVVTTVFDALLADSGQTLRDRSPGEGFDRSRYAIPVSQWTAIVMAVTDHAYAWDAAVSTGMVLAALMPAAYDDPAVPTPHLGTPDTHLHILRLDIGRGAAAMITACGNHLTALANAYGADSTRYRMAAISWVQQLIALLTSPPGARHVLHPDGPLSLYASTDDGYHYGIAFQPEPRRCTAVGCHAVTTDPGVGARWQPATPGAFVGEHEHLPSYPFDAPQPGRWITKP